MGFWAKVKAFFSSPEVKGAVSAVTEAATKAAIAEVKALADPHVTAAFDVLKYKVKQHSSGAHQKELLEAVTALEKVLKAAAGG